MSFTYTNAELANIFAHDLWITPGCDNEVEQKALDSAREIIKSVLDELENVSQLSTGRKEYAALVMGQYAFDEACAGVSQLTDLNGAMNG
jgi:hypothetical protein